MNGLTVVHISSPTGAFASGILCDDYTYQYSNSFAGAYKHSKMAYTIFVSGYGSTLSGINWTVQVTTDPNETIWYDYVSGTAVNNAVTGVSLDVGYPFSRVALRIDASGYTAVSGFAWVGTVA